LSSLRSAAPNDRSAVAQLRRMFDVTRPDRADLAVVG
jgi:hypothetical protein